MVEDETTAPAALVAHAIPGRTRLRIPARRRQAEFFAALAERLAAHPGIRRVRVNPSTASILLQHEGSIEDIAPDLRDTLLIVLEEAQSAAARTMASPPQLTPAAATQMLALACVLLGAWQLRRGRVFGTASEQVWNAFNAWRNLRSPAAAAALLGGGLAQLARGRVLSSASSLIYYALNMRRS
jgi:hypothetical protein